MVSTKLWQGKPVIDLNPDTYPHFSFGVSKAEMILENIDKIVEFVKEHTDDPTIIPHFEEKLNKLTNKKPK